MAGLRVGDPAPDLALLGEDEKPAQLSQFWGDAPLVALFLRHFG